MSKKTEENDVRGNSIGNTKKLINFKLLNLPPNFVNVYKLSVFAAPSGTVG